MYLIYLIFNYIFDRKNKNILKSLIHKFTTNLYSKIYNFETNEKNRNGTYSIMVKSHAL
jgi:hypothetical protein